MGLPVPPLLLSVWDCWDCNHPVGPKANQFAHFKDLCDFQQNNDLEQNCANQSVLQLNNFSKCLWKYFFNCCQQQWVCFAFSQWIQQTDLLSWLIAALPPPTSSSTAHLNKNGYIRSGRVTRSSLLVYIHCYSREQSCRSFTLQICMYWLLWCEPLIMRKADLFPLQTLEPALYFQRQVEEHYHTTFNRPDVWHIIPVYVRTGCVAIFLIDHLAAHWHKERFDQNLRCSVDLF